MREFILSPVGLALGILCVLILFWFALRGIWQPRDAPRYISPERIRRGMKKAARRADTREGGKRK